MPFNSSIDVNAWKLIQWSADVPKLDGQLTELALKLSTWATSANQALSTGASLPLANTSQSGLLRQTTGNTSDFLDGTNNYQNFATALANLFIWTSFTLTVVPGAGTITTQSSNSSYIKIGKLVIIRFWVQVPNIGTASGTTTLSGLPFVCSPTGAAFYLRETVINGLGYTLACANGATTGALVTTANASPAWANNITYIGQGVYQTS